MVSLCHTEDVLAYMYHINLEVDKHFHHATLNYVHVLKIGEYSAPNVEVIISSFL